MVWRRLWRAVAASFVAGMLSANFNGRFLGGFFSPFDGRIQTSPPEQAFHQEFSKWPARPLPT
jgi:hypothetical protein